MKILFIILKIYYFYDYQIKEENKIKIKKIDDLSDW